MSINTLITIFLAISGCFIAAGIFNFALIVLKIPASKTTRAIKSVAKSQKTSSDILKNYYNDISLFVSKFVIMSEFKRNKLQDNLHIANIAMKPEVFVARAIVKAAGTILLAIPTFLILSTLSVVFAAIISIAVVILGFLMYAQENRKVENCIIEKRKSINADLPRFVYAITQELQTDHDVLSILERHKDNFSDSFNEEVAITIADMRSGNYEAALQRFEGRIGSTNLSEVVRGLIEMTRGNDTHVYWETLAFRFSEMQKQELRKLAMKVPEKIHKLSFVLMIGMLMLYMVVLGYQMIVNVNLMF